MNKKEFLNKLKKRLSILKESEIEDILEEYEGHINEKIASGKTEKEAIKDFGDFDLLVKEILSAYKINESYEKEKNEKNVVTDFIETSVNFIKDFLDNISKKSKEDLIRFIVEFITLIIFISIMKIPVLFISELGEWLFERLISPFGDGLAVIWKFMVEVIYLILVIVGIVNFVKKRYMKIDEREIKDKKEEKQSVETLQKVNKKDKQKDNKRVHSFTKMVTIILKIFLIFILIPALFSFIASCVILVLGVLLLIQGIPYIGIFLCLLTYVCLNYIFIDLCFRFIYNKKINLKGLIISVIASVVLFSVGIGLSFYEVVNTTFINGAPPKYNKITKEKREVYNENTVLACDYFYHTSCLYEIDDSLNDEIITTVTYYEYNKNFEITDDLKYVEKENKEYSLKEAYYFIISDLKERKIYNYNKLSQIKVKIKASSEVMDKINKRSYYN